jgi:uncharacterized phiE125 gp8 family phage protein
VERYTRTAEPIALAVTLDDAKRHLRIDFDIEDMYIRSLIETAVAWLETAVGRTLITTNWKVIGETWPCGRLIELKFPPLQEITSVKYYDEDDVLQTLATDKYLTILDDFMPGGIELKHEETWPALGIRHDAVQIEYVAGYGDLPSEIPHTARQCILMLVGHWYLNREAVLVGTISKEIELAVASLARTLKTCFVPGA